MSSYSEHRCERCEKSFSRRENLKQHREQGKCSTNLENSAAYACEVCKKSFSRKDALKRHSELRICLRPPKQKIIHTCELCNKIFARKDRLQRHKSRPCFRSPNKTETYACDHCKKTFTSKASLERHITDKICQRTIGSTFQREQPPKNFQLPSGVEIKATAFNRLLIDYLLTNEKGCKSIEEFFAYVRPKLIQLLEYELQEKKNMKVNMYLICNFFKLPDDFEPRNFKTAMSPIFFASCLDEFLDTSFEKLLHEMEDHEAKKSGWTLDEVLSLELRISKYDPLRINSKRS